MGSGFRRNDSLIYFFNSLTVWFADADNVICPEQPRLAAGRFFQETASMLKWEHEFGRPPLARPRRVPDETKRMFGGFCFMLNGNMLMGTFRGGLMARVSKASHAEALKIPGAKAMEMKGRVMEGFILIDADSVEDDAALQRWIDMALAYNATLPAKATKPAKKAKRA